MNLPNRSLRLSGLLAVTLLLAGLACVAPSVDPGPPAPLHVVILETNDMHGAALAQPATWIRAENPPPAGGFAALAAKIRKIRRTETEAGAKVLLFDAGDFFQGTPEGDMTEGRLVVEVMNSIGYDALEVGNHDFDLGPAVPEALSKQAKFPFLGANVRVAGTKSRPAWLRDTVDFPKLRIEVAGIITDQMASLTGPRSRAGLEFDPVAEALDRIPWKAGRVKVLLTHLGVDDDRKLAATGKMDVLLGGHSHTRVTEKIGAVTMAQAGGQGTNLARVDLWIDPASGKLLRSEARLEPVSPGEDGEDPEVAKILARYAPEIEKTMAAVVGDLSEDVSRSSSDGRSSPLGNWLCDLMREATGAEIAIHNRTAIRASLRKGPVRRRDLYEVSPFRNTLVTMKLTGRQVVALLEADLTGGRMRSEVSGLEVVFDPVAKKLDSVSAGGRPIDPDREYSVVTNSHLARGGSGYKVFAEGKEIRDTGVDLLEIHEADVVKNPGRKIDRTERVHPKPGVAPPATPAAPASATTAAAAA